jgi:hypothetical protein
MNVIGATSKAAKSCYCKEFVGNIDLGRQKINNVLTKKQCDKKEEKSKYKNCEWKINLKNINKVKSGCTVQSNFQLGESESISVKDAYKKYISKTKLGNNYCFPDPKKSSMSQSKSIPKIKCNKNFQDTVQDKLSVRTAAKIYKTSGRYSIAGSCNNKLDKTNKAESSTPFSIPDGSELHKISATSFPQLIGKSIKLILQVIGTAALAMFIYGGLLIMTSRGQSDKYNQGMKTMLWSAIGVITALSSYALVSFVFSAF